VPLLVRSERNELVDWTWSRQPGHQNLARVDAYGTVLTGMIDLDDSVSQVFAIGRRDCSHEAGRVACPYGRLRRQ